MKERLTVALICGNVMKELPEQVVKSAQPNKSIHAIKQTYSDAALPEWVGFFWTNPPSKMGKRKYQTRNL
jgi:hypothetical protein